MIAFLAGPSFQDASGSAAFATEQIPIAKIAIKV
jgi:hypothetical protein